METMAFVNVKNQIGRCGIWCCSCAIGNGDLKTLTKRCEHIISGYGVDEWGATNFDGKEFMKGLTSIQGLPICKGCLKDGGNNECKIRPCVVNRKLNDCTECSEMKICKNLEPLQKVRKGALQVGMLVRFENDKTDHQASIKKWTAEIKSKCPHCRA